MPPRKEYLPRSTKRIRARKKDPAKRRFAQHRVKPFTDWIKTLECHICGWPPVDPAHVIPQSRGGDDINNVLPLCRFHHDLQEGRTAECEAEYGVNLTSVAQMYTKQWFETPTGAAWLAQHPEARA